MAWFDRHPYTWPLGKLKMKVHSTISAGFHDPKLRPCICLDFCVMRGVIAGGQVTVDASRWHMTSFLQCDHRPPTTVSLREQMMWQTDM